MPATPVTLYFRDGCPACAEAKAFLERRGVAHTVHDVVRQPLDGPATLQLLRPCRRFFVRVGEDLFLWDRDQEEVPTEALRRHFVHFDGFIRIPVLIAGTTAVRGFSPELYSKVLGPPPG